MQKHWMIQVWKSLNKSAHYCVPLGNFMYEHVIKKENKIIIFMVALIPLFCVLTVFTFISATVTSMLDGVASVVGFPIVSIQSDSMAPTLNPGDLVITSSANAEDLQSGDIITYWTIINAERVLNTHRITAIYDGGGYLIFETKGDKNTSVDCITVNERDVIGKYLFRIPFLGKIFDIFF